MKGSKTPQEIVGTGNDDRADVGILGGDYAPHPPDGPKWLSAGGI